MIFAIGFTVRELDVWCREHGVDMRRDVRLANRWQDICGFKGEEHSYVLGYTGQHEYGLVRDVRERGFRPYAEVER